MQEFINKFKNNKIFDELYVLILAIIILLSWDWFFTLGTAIVIVLASAAIILLNDFKYLIPATLFFVFSNRDGFSTDRFPYELAVGFGILAIAVIYYMIKNRKDICLKNNKSILGIALLSIAYVIPIFWAKIPADSPVYYLLYFSYFLYLLTYFIFASNLKDTAFLMCKKSVIYLGIILAFQCMIEIYTLKVNYPNLVLSSVTFYSLGWGCCNEAGIIMLMALPFLFIDYARHKELSYNILTTFKLLIIGLGITFTFSRGAYLFGVIELAFLTIYTFFKAKSIKIYTAMITVLAIVMIIGVEVIFGWPKFVYNIVINGVFNSKFDDSNRFMFWESAIRIYNRNYVTMTFGNGIISEFAVSNVRNGAIISQVVYHSTLFEILVSAGNFGLAFLIIHFVQKYWNLKFAIHKKEIFIYLLTSYLVVDGYGLFDNTYGMYYFMIPLMIIMASYDCSKPLGENYE